MPCSRDGQPRCLEITVQAHQSRDGQCSRCFKPAPAYDHLPQRSWLFVPMWGIVTWKVTPLESFRERLTEERQAVERLKKMMK